MNCAVKCKSIILLLVLLLANHAYATPFAWAIRALTGATERSVATSTIRGARTLTTVEAESAESAAARYAAKNNRSIRRTANQNVFEIIDNMGNVIEIINPTTSQPVSLQHSHPIQKTGTVHCNSGSPGQFHVELITDHDLSQSEVNAVCQQNAPSRFRNATIHCYPESPGYFVVNTPIDHDLNQDEVNIICGNHAPQQTISNNCYVPPLNASCRSNPAPTGTPCSCTFINPNGMHFGQGFISN